MKTASQLLLTAGAFLLFFATATAQTIPTIITQPASQSSAVGGTIQFTVSASGPGTLAYLWRKNTTNLVNGGNIAGATTPTLTISNITTNNQANYTCRITNSSGSVTSSIATLTVIVPPAITTQPKGANTNTGATVTFSVNASGTAPFTYQWYKDAVSIPNATLNAYTLGGLVLSDSGTYNVRVSNAAGSTTSSDALLNVGIAPAFTSQPSSLTVTQGQSATFSVGIIGNPLNYFWRKNGVPIAGATNSTFIIPAAFGIDAATYSVVVSNFLNSVTSAGAALTVIVPASISVQPASQIVGEGSNTTFTVLAAGTALNYQWFKGGTNIPGATASAYDINNTQFSDAADYTVTVSNVLTVVISEVATLTVQRFSPAITVQPADQNMPVGSNVTFNVGATGTTLNYQWLKDATNILDTSGPVLSLTNLTLLDTGGYSVIVANPVGSVTSVVARLNVGYVPLIVQQPQPFANVLGTSNAFSVTVSGTEPFTYQWMKDDVAITDATNSLLALPNLQSNQVGYYSVSVTNLFGWATSSSALITALYPPTISVQPVSQTLLVGSNFTLTVNATGTAPFAFQWRKGVADLSGGVGSNYTVTGAQTNDTGPYTVVVTNLVGSVTSVVAQVNVGYAPVILQQPQSFTNNLGESNAFSVVVSGSEPLIYQWFKDGMGITDATNSLLPLSNLQSNLVGYYSVTVTNLYGWTVSSNALLSIPGVPLPFLWQGLVAYYPFNGNANDESPSGNDGMVVGASLGTNRFGVTSNSYHFAQAGSFILTSNSVGFPVATDDFSISIWACFSSFSAGMLCVNQSMGDFQLWFGGFTGSKSTLNFQTGGGGLSGSYSDYCTSPALDWTQNRWYNIQVHRSSNILTLFRDGTVVAQVVMTKGNEAPPTARNLSFGLRAQDGANQFYGQLDDIRIYGRALSTNELAQLYALEADLPVITAQPQNQTVVRSGTAVFSVTATAVNPLAYQWFKDGLALAGATNTALILTNIQPNQIGAYSVAVSNAVTGILSANAVLTVIVPPSIDVQPADQNIPVGSNVTFTVGATGTTLNYQWLKDATNILDASGPVLSLTNLTMADAGGYSVIITNTVGSVTSVVAQLNVGYAPVILQQPFSVTNYPGGTASFSCIVTGSHPLNLQWLFNGAPVPNQTNSTLTLTNLQYSDFGYYALAATNIFGGTASSNAALRVYAATRSWKLTGSLGAGRVSHTATLLGDGRVLVAGGTGSDGNPVLTAELYNPVSGIWTAAGNLATGRYLHTATLLSNGKVLIAGGADSISSVELFEPATGNWTAASSLSTARYAHTATFLPNGKVFIAAGVNTGGFLATSELFDPATGAWTPGGTLAARRSYHSATLLPDGKLIFAAGYNGSLLASAELFDSANNTWALTGNLTTARWYHTANLLHNGKVLVVGGGTTSASVHFSSVELYDPFTGTWTTKGNMTAARRYHTATLLPSGVTLVVGGQNSSGPLSSAELFNPDTEAWTAATALKTNRQQHTATLLLDGRVLVVGGQNANGTLASAELYDKAAAIVALNNLSQTYDGTARSVTATTTPPGLAMDLTYNGSANAPTNFGSYTVVATINDLNYQGSATNTLVILPAPMPINVIDAAMQPDGSFQFAFSNTPGVSFSVLATTNVVLSLSNWKVLGAAIETPLGSGQFQFTDPQATNDPQRFYRIRSP